MSTTVSAGSTTGTASVVFERERETKATWRFQEQRISGDEPIVGVLYVRKSALAMLGNPDSLRIKIERGAE